MEPSTPLGGDTYEIWLGALQSTYRELVEAAAALVPNLIGAVVILIGGWIIAWLLRALIVRVSSGLDRLFEAAKQRTGQPAMELRWPLSRILAHSIYWLVILFFLTAAANVLGLPGIAELFSAILRYLPVLIATAAVLVAVYLLSGFLGDLSETAARSAGVASAGGLGRLVRFTIMALALIIAIGQLGVDTRLLVNIATVIATMFLGGAALAFGIGAATEVRNILSVRYARRHYDAGQRIRVGDIEGEIVEITRGAIIIDAEDGRTLLPARLLSETPTILIDEGEPRA